jgi:hypothetical protein
MRARARSRRTIGLRGDEALTLDLFAPLAKQACSPPHVGALFGKHVRQREQVLGVFVMRR